MAPVTDYVYRKSSENARQLIERDIQTISPSYTRTYGFAVSHGKGAEVWDVDDNRYIDFASGIAVLSTGFSHPRIVKAIQEQAERYIHIGGTDFFAPRPVELAEKLQEIIPIHNANSPSDKRIYYGNSGTEAVEAALKLARYQGRSHVIAFYGGFHGRTMGSLSLTASKNIQRARYPYIPGGVTHIPYPAKDTCDENGAWCDAKGYIEKFVFQQVPPNEVAAIIVEPIQGEGGYRLPVDNFLPDLRQLCDEHGILLIADEIQSGVGRTGKWCAIEHWNVAPDIVCLAKGLGSGVPIGATVAHVDVMGHWLSGAHASTFGGNPLACVAACETIAIIEDEGLLDHVTTLGEYAMERVQAWQSTYPVISRVGGKGFMIGIDFVDSDGKPDSTLRNEIVNEAFLNGLITLGCGKNGIRFAPPLVLPRDLLDEGLDLLERSIANVLERMA